ncbi:hypothetical protein AC95_5138 [Escherichia coli 2-052-05_S4_C2]|nr:hypothetical protein AC95_5138 [Escherichia coli 2-052-05_S4_C2]
MWGIAAAIIGVKDVKIKKTCTNDGCFNYHNLSLNIML